MLSGDHERFCDGSQKAFLGEDDIRFGGRALAGAFLVGKASNPNR